MPYFVHFGCYALLAFCFNLCINSKNLQNQNVSEAFPWQFCFHFWYYPVSVSKPLLFLLGRWILSSLMLKRGSWWFIVPIIELGCAMKPQPDLWGRHTESPFREELLPSVRFCLAMEKRSCQFDGKSEPPTKLLMDKISLVSSWPSVFPQICPS